MLLFNQLNRTMAHPYFLNFTSVITLHLRNKPLLQLQYTLFKYLPAIANISQTDKATPFKFGTHIDGGQFLPRATNWPEIGRRLGQVPQFRNFGSPQYFANYDLQIWHAHRPWAVLAHGPQIGP